MNQIIQMLKKFSYIILLIILPAFFPVILHAQLTTVSDTGYFVPWDDNYNLILAVNKSDSLNIQFLLDRGANVNTTTIDGVTPLMYAAESGNFGIVRLLCERGANINIKPYNGATALIAATKNNFYEICEYLMGKKAEPDIRVDEGITAVNYAAAYNNYDIMDMLIFHGANMEMPDNKGNTPLISAAYNNSLEAVDLLIQNGANIDSSDTNGFTPLMVAIQGGNIEIAYLLIDKGAEINLVNKAGYSALAYAVISKDPVLTELLISKGANVNQKTNSGFSILEFARIADDDEIIEILQSNNAKLSLSTHFNTISIGPYLDFNFTDYMNGLQCSYLDSRYGIGLNGGFGFRPLANRVLMEQSDTVSFQYWERRYYVYAGFDKKFDFLRSPDVATGPYLGLNEYFTFGGYRGSDKNPKKKLITAPAAGWFYSNNTFKTWIGYQHLDFMTPDVKPGRICLGISINIDLDKKKFLDKKIDWLE